MAMKNYWNDRCEEYVLELAGVLELVLMGTGQGARCLALAP